MVLISLNTAVVFYGTVCMIWVVILSLIAVLLSTSLPPVMCLPSIFKQFYMVGKE